MNLLPLLISAEYRGGHRIYLVFNDNTEKTIDFSAWLEGPVFEPLKDQDTSGDSSSTAARWPWPNGADVAPEMLYEKSGEEAA